MFLVWYIPSARTLRLDGTAVVMEVVRRPGGGAQDLQLCRIDLKRVIYVHVIYSFLRKIIITTRWDKSLLDTGLHRKNNNRKVDKL